MPNNPVQEQAEKASIDDFTKDADKYMKYMDTDNQAQIKEEHIDAHHEAYSNAVTYMVQSKKVPEFGKEIEDEAVVNNILLEYLGTLIEEVGGSKDFRDNFKKRKFKKEAERYSALVKAAETLLGVDPGLVAQLRQSITANRGIKDAVESTMGQYMTKGEALEHQNGLMYIDTVGQRKYAHRSDLMLEFAKTHKSMEQYVVKDEGKFYNVHPGTAKPLFDTLAADRPLSKRGAKEIGLEKAEVEYKKDKKAA